MATVHPETTQPSLLSRVRDAGDEEAWRTFDARYRDLITRYARARGLQEADAEDARQLVLMALSRSLRSFRYRPELGRFRDYLRTVVRNATTKLLSRPISERRELWDGELEDFESPEHEDLDELWEREWMHHHFRRALRRARKRFDPRSLSIFEALCRGSDVEDLTREFGVTRDVVYKVRQRMKHELEGLIAEQLRDEEFPERAT